MNLTDSALKVLSRRALRHNGGGGETPEEAFLRVARVVAGAERFYGYHEKTVKKTEEKFFQIQKNLEFLSGKPLIQAGRPDKTLSACFVLPVEDSMEGIFGTLKDMIMIAKMGGGNGFNFSQLRSRDELVGSSEEPAAGPVYFLKVYSQALKVVRDRGGRQIGAMGILNAGHPDIRSFIRLKDEDPTVTNFNFSVGASDRFMEKVQEDGKNWELIDPHTKEVKEKVSAKNLFSKIVESAWRAGDPGCVFLDALERDNPTPTLGKLDGTNVCGEQPLLPYEACNLGSLVLSRFVKDEEVDYKRLEEVTRTAVRFLDDVIDVNNYPLPENEEICKGNRKMGLGVMGFADLLIKLGIPYASQEAVDLAEETMEFITKTAREESVKLARERGSFPNFPLSIWPEKGFSELRNASVTTIAPTGTTSIVADCSAGIEPIFALGFVQRQVMKEGDEIVKVNSLFEDVAKERGFYSEELLRKIAETGSCQELKEVPQDVRELFQNAHEVSPEWHVKIQAAFQEHTDSAVSKTVNFPNSATVDDIRRAYLLAWELGCKGITVYRNRSRQEQVMNVGTPSKE